MTLWFPFRQKEPADYSVVPLEEADAPMLARLHKEDFIRPWSDGEFAALLAQDTVFGFSVRETGNGKAGPLGFILARHASDEGEVLTVAVARSHRRRGLGWKLMDAVLRELHGRRAAALFLEVDETNTAAIALYKRLGFHQVGLRPRYYQAADKEKTGALVMRRDLR
jgi:[ribosomal protein S18]-alanine N-acetyltransferase